MGRRIRRYAFVLCLAGALLVPPAAAADPILIRWGHLEISPVGGFDGLANMELAGTRGFRRPDPDVPIFTLLGFGPVFNFPGPRCVLFECPPTTSIDLWTVWLDVVGTATLDGRTFRVHPFDIDEDAAAIGVEFFGTAVAPSFDGGMTTVTAPFRFEGIFHAEPGSERLRGGGNATLWLDRIGEQIDDQFIESWAVSRVRYDFVDPIPEPGTLLLLGGGLVGLAGRAYRRRRTHVVRSAALQGCGAAGSPS